MCQALTKHETSMYQACSKCTLSMSQSVPQGCPSAPRPCQPLSRPCPQCHWCLRPPRGACAPSTHPHNPDTDPSMCTCARATTCVTCGGAGLSLIPSPPWILPDPHLWASLAFPPHFLSLLPFFLPAKPPRHGCLPAPINLLPGLEWWH